MNSQEREPHGYRRKLIKGAARILAIAALAVAPASGSAEKNGDSVGVSGQTNRITTPNRDLLEVSPESNYRNLEIIKKDDEILAAPEEVLRFRFDQELVTDHIDDEAEKSGYLSFRSGEYANKILLPTPIPATLRQELHDTIEPIDQMINGSSRKIQIVLFVYDQGDEIKLNGTGYISADKSKQIIELSVSPNVDITKSELKDVVVNEASHILYRTVLVNLYNSEELNDFYTNFLDDADNQVIADTKNPDSLLYKQDVSELMSRMPREHRSELRSTANNALFRVFTEKSYIGQGGHPWDSSEEFFTSALTVLLNYHKSFIATTQNLSEEDRKTVDQFARFVTKQVGEKLFDPNLINYLSTRNG